MIGCVMLIANRIGYFLREKTMKNFLKKTILLILIGIVAFVYYYVTLPAVNIHSAGFWFFIMAIFVAVIGLYLYKINMENMMEYTYDFVTTDVNTIIHLPFNEKGSWEDFHSVETLWDAIHSDKFKYPEELKIIELNWFINSFKKGWYSIKPEDFKLQYWTADEIYKKLEFYKGLQKINYIINKGKEI